VQESFPVQYLRQQGVDVESQFFHEYLGGQRVTVRLPIMHARPDNLIVCKVIANIG
jgi:hypothetical protein